MRNIVLLLLLLCLNCGENDKKTEINEDVSPDSQVEEKSENMTDYTLEVYDFQELKPIINKTDDKIHVVNFWATWCGPCIKELPYFETVTEAYDSNNVEVLLVSLDFPNKYETALKPFIVEHNLKSKVVALNDVDANSWIPEVDETWSGALPATIIYKGEQRKFYEQSFTLEELKHEINQFLN